MNLKIFMTAQLMAIIVAMSAWSIDHNNQTTTGYTDGGWTRHYTIPRKIRKITTNMLLGAGILSFVSIIYFIWSF